MAINLHVYTFLCVHPFLIRFSRGHGGSPLCLCLSPRPVSRPQQPSQARPREAMAADFQLAAARQEKSARVLADAPPSVVPDWQVTKEARVYTGSLINNRRRRQFGLLDNPLDDSPVLARLPIYSTRLLLLGRAGVGKTSTVQKLSGRPVPKSYQETLGVQTSTVYWPVKMSRASRLGGGVKRNTALLQLELWDSGERALQSQIFERIVSSWLTSVNAVAFFFSFTNRRSWEELPDFLQSTQHQLEGCLKVVIGTRSDSVTREVTQSEVDTFQSLYGVRVLSIGNVDGPLLSDGVTPDGQASLADIAPLLNTFAELILEYLWEHQHKQWQREGVEKKEGSLKIDS